MKDLAGKKVLMFQQRGWGVRIGHFLAQQLDKEGCRLAALTFKRSTDRFVRQQGDARYELIINNDDIMSRPLEYLDGDRFSMQEICNELDVDSIWPIVASSRRHVKSYGDKFYYSFRKNMSDEAILNYIQAEYKCIKRFFTKFKPDIIVAPNFPDITHLMFNLYARKRGVKMIAVTNCGVKGITLFSNSYLEDDNEFNHRLNKLNASEVQSKNSEMAKRYIHEFRESFKLPDYSEHMKKKKSFIKKIRAELSPYRSIFRWYTRKQMNYIDSAKITIDYRPPRIVLRDHYTRKKYKRFMEKYDYFPFEKVGKFAYFPLQVQPEANIDVRAVYFSNQLETARLVAMSLPDDYTLVVKEHPAMVGQRSPSYIKKLARTPNVKFIDYKIPSEKVLKQTDLVVSPSGTTIIEAAFYNKPAIQLGNLGTTQMLPNVFHHTDMTTISKKIKELLNKNFHTDEYERQLENYVAACYDTGFEFNYWGVWERAEKEDMDRLWQIYKKELIRNLV